MPYIHFYINTPVQNKQSTTNIIVFVNTHKPVLYIKSMSNMSKSYFIQHVQFCKCQEKCDKTYKMCI